MRGLVIVVVVVVVLALVAARGAAAQLSERVQQMLREMTIEEKVGQLSQLNTDLIWNRVTGRIDRDQVREYARTYFIGSYLNSPTSGAGEALNVTEWLQAQYDIQSVYVEEGLPPMIFGVDSVHGANYVDGATLFPQQINAGASFDPDVAETMGHVTAIETRAAGMPWTFAPILDIAMHPAWARVYETFGEDPKLASVMGAAIVRGFQGFPADLRANDRVAATMKHFIGYGNARTGKDRTTVSIPDRQLRQYYLPSFQAAVDAGVATAMESYNDVNGEPVIASNKYLRKILRDELGFDGMLVTDWNEINDLVGFHKIVPDRKEAARIVMERTSVDMSMIPSEVTFCENLVELVREGTIPESRLDESAGRVLQLKENLGLLDNPLPDFDNPNIGKIGGAEHRQLALDAARSSIVLLENRNNALPLRVGALSRIFVVGFGADSLSTLCGGWTINWQGATSESYFKFGSTIVSAIRAIAEPSGIAVDYQYGFNAQGQYTDDSLQQALEATRSSDVTIVCMGEGTYAEAPGNIDNVALPNGQLEYLRQLIATGRPVIVVLTQGRPRILYDATDKAAAVINAMLPCLEGGQAIAEVLFGQVNPSGRLPVSYPRNPASVPLQYYRLASAGDDFAWRFGHGLSYSTFVYSNLVLSNTTIRAPSGTIDVSVTVTNQGPYAGRDAVLLYLEDEYREVTPEARLLWAFTKVSLGVNESTVVRATITVDDLAFYGIDETQKVVEAGTHKVHVGSLQATFTLVV
eukprot:Unigene349_Nuclearia_a/m.1214 Unigene349_Nuclearia_a/g.1214  ORF Unigene349_Nuclearia_a/g.1214 Unigene349_Nuclearia_a/m.1214 type:complete len:752 (-) Unigene349_Nuclearia_a:47-2302(-)